MQSWLGVTQSLHGIASRGGRRAAVAAPARCDRTPVARADTFTVWGARALGDVNTMSLSELQTLQQQAASLKASATDVVDERCASVARTTRTPGQSPPVALEAADAVGTACPTPPARLNHCTLPPRCARRKCAAYLERRAGFLAAYKRYFLKGDHRPIAVSRDSGLGPPDRRACPTNLSIRPLSSQRADPLRPSTPLSRTWRKAYGRRPSTPQSRRCALRSWHPGSRPPPRRTSPSSVARRPHSSAGRTPSSSSSSATSRRATRCAARKTRGRPCVAQRRDPSQLLRPERAGDAGGGDFRGADGVAGWCGSSHRCDHRDGVPRCGPHARLPGRPAEVPGRDDRGTAGREGEEARRCQLCGA